MKKHNPRRGSMQFWPRVRAKRALARIRTWKQITETKPLCFTGYKVGMCHLMATDPKAKVERALPCTIIECPPIKILSVRFYRNNQLLTEVLNPSLDDSLKRTIRLPKTAKNIDEVKDYDAIRALFYTQPKLTAIGMKKPDIFEAPVGGKEPLAWVKENMNKDIALKDVFAENTQVDAHVVTKGKGYQGVIKRFGIDKRQHKSEKGVRRVGARSGAWCAQMHMMYRVAQPGKMGYHQRTEYNKLILKIDAPLNPASGWKYYGVTKNTCVLILGSIGGATKRAVKLTPAIRPRKNLPKLNIGKAIL